MKEESVRKDRPSSATAGKPRKLYTLDQKLEAVNLYLKDRFPQKLICEEMCVKRLWSSRRRTGGLG